MHLVTTRRRVSAVAKSCHCSAIRLLFEDTSKYTRLQGGKQVKNTKKLHEKLKMEERKEGRMNERGFPATAGRSLARSLDRFPFIFDLRFRSSSFSLARCSVASFQLPFSLRSRLQGRCNLDAYVRSPENGAFSFSFCSLPVTKSFRLSL